MTDGFDRAPSQRNSADVLALAGGTEFLSSFKGDVIMPASPDYDSARRIWNRDADRRPLAVVGPRDERDVVSAVRLARTADLPLAVRGGGHSYQGHSTCDDGIVVDLSMHMNGVEFDPASGLVRIQGGALLGDVDRATMQYGRVMPSGIVSHTGMGGLALGGGIGHLTRSFGLTCDQFVRLRLVTAAGEILDVSENENSDLFWALQGGGGNFGVVTRFECRTHELGPLQGGALTYPMDDAVDVIESMAELMQDAPRELRIAMALATDPARSPRIAGEPRLGDASRLLVVSVVYRGGPDAEILKELRNVHPPLTDLIRPLDFLELQTQRDEEAQHGVGWYMKSGFTRSLSRSLIEQLVRNSLEYSEVRVPEVRREAWIVTSLGGAVSDVDEDATAFSGRDAQWHCAIEVGFMNREQRDRIVSWTRQAWDRTEPLLDMGTSYSNMNFAEGLAGAEKVYGAAKLHRLRKIKQEYDRTNLFRLNSNILPLEP